MLKYFNIESVKIACWVNKDNLDEQKPSLVFIHGSGGNHSIWAHQYGHLSKNYNTIAVNLPGHGHSGGAGEKDVKIYCEWVKKLLNASNLKKVVLVGHSLGSAIALQFAIDYSDKIMGIVCMGGGMKMPVNSFFLDFLKTNPSELPEDVTGMISKFSLAKENRPKFFAPLQKSISESKVDVLYGDLTACNDLDLTQTADKIIVPALIVCGAEDKMTPPDLSRALAAGISKSKLEIIAGAGHMVMIEKPVEFNNALDTFAVAISTVVSG
jgi:pimeloyl-ACP methyl ester carboxylesterase